MPGRFGELPDVLNPKIQPPSPPDRRVSRAPLNQVISNGPQNMFPQVVGTTVVRALSTNERRNYLFIQNNGTSAVYVGLGANPSATGFFLKIVAGGYWEPLSVPTNAVNLISGVAGQNVVVIEGIAP